MERACGAVAGSMIQGAAAEAGRSAGSLSGAAWIVSAACALALLHYGRPVLEPLALAGILTLTLAPLVRRIRVLGLGHVAATFVSVGCVAACVLALAAVLASQAADVMQELPQYRTAFAAKIDELSALVVRPLERWDAEITSLLPESREARASLAETSQSVAPPIAVEIRRPHADAGTALSRFFTAVWGPIGEAAIVFVLLLFMMLGRDSIRERLIRLAGEREVAHTMQALADTDEGVSRFFASLVVVNAAFAAACSIVLAILGVPHAILWGTLAGIMRFVPYVGVPAAIAAVAAFAAAVDAGWSLALWSAASLVTLEALLANVIEPHVYGHTIGIAPFGIVAAALFWGALWGPVGLIVSTPLTLCLVVAGRHVRALAPIAILFGESPGTTLGLRLYQRALAGDAQDVVDEARDYVRRHGVARYCDDMLLPAFALASTDARAGRIDTRQDTALRVLLVNVVESMRGRRTARPRPSLVEANLGRQLRALREARLTPRESRPAESRSAVLCAGLEVEQDEVVAELMARAVRDAHLEAHSIPLGERVPDLDRGKDFAVVLLPCPSAEQVEVWRNRCKRLRERLPRAVFALVRPPEGVHAAMPPDSEVRREVDLVLQSFSEAVAFAATAGAAEEARVPG
ncbi:MAG TPA: AI-2E family transporter [Usitatibacter sp.]|nr:AI-2E family transporter [Usitatibacter sp.]